VSAFRDALADLAASDPHRHAERLEELAYLVNVLIAAGEAKSQFGAIELVIEACAAALQHLAKRGSLARLGADKLFRIGWQLRKARSPDSKAR
jgi:hypothetical protein